MILNALLLLLDMQFGGPRHSDNRFNAALCGG
jgi:hypothetical protein